jgi:integrase
MTIPEPRFYLKDIKAIAPTLIYLQAKYSINEQSQRVMLCSADKILPSEWDNIKQRAVVSRKCLANGDINLYLDKMAASFKSAFRNLLIDGVLPTKDAVKEKLEEVLNLKPKFEIPKVTFYSFIESFINENKVQRANATIKAYTSTFNRIKEFGLLSNKVFLFDDIDLTWRANFIAFLQMKGVCRTTEGKYIKNLKTFLNEATERGINSNLIFRNKSFSKPNEESHKVYLNRIEIKKIFDVDLSDDKMMCTVRDYFIIACLTSLRYSDFIRIRPEHIQNGRIHMITSKTDQEVVIPISPLVDAILKKYNYDLPKAPCNQVFNRYLKDIGKKAEIMEDITITKTIAGVKNTKVYKKYELISSHTGRRSLISNCILEGMSSNSIMLISAHKSHKVFSSYARFDINQNADALAKLPFFNK